MTRKRIESLKPEQLNCNIFSVYDYQGATIQELLCQFFTKINECIEISQNTSDLTEWLVNEGLSREVVNQLLKWKEDGTLAQVINEGIFNELNTKIEKNKNDLIEFKKSLATEEIVLIKGNIYGGSPGDCILIKAKDGSYSMIDCLEDGNFPYIVKELKKRGIEKLKYLLITHHHTDHIGTAPEVIRKYKPDELVTRTDINWENTPVEEIAWKTEEAYYEMIQAAKEVGTHVAKAQNQTIDLGGGTTTELYGCDFHCYSTNFNNSSVNYIVNFDGYRALFPGDTAAELENFLYGKIGKVDIYKMSHHGNYTGNQRKNLKEYSPTTVINNKIRDYNDMYVRVKSACNNVAVYALDNNDCIDILFNKGKLINLSRETLVPNIRFKDPEDGETYIIGNDGRLGFKVVDLGYGKYFVEGYDGKAARNKWVKDKNWDFRANEYGYLMCNQWFTDEYSWWLNGNCTLNYGGGLIEVDGIKYILGNSGAMKAGDWTEIDGYYYYSYPNGKVHTDGWIELGDRKWYYMNANGVAYRNGTFFIEGLWYDFDDQAHCLNPSDGRPTKNKGE